MGTLNSRWPTAAILDFSVKKIKNHIFMDKSQKCSCNISRNMFLGSRNPFLTSDLIFNPNYAKWGAKKDIFWVKIRQKSNVPNMIDFAHYNIARYP